MNLYVIFWGDNHAIVRAKDTNRAYELVEERFTPEEYLSSGEISSQDEETILFAYTRKESS